MSKMDALCMGVIGAITVAGITAHSMMPAPKTELIQYQKEVAMGDTVWSICKEIATDEDDVILLVNQAMKDNHIKNPDCLTPGTLLVVNVQRAREK